MPGWQATSAPGHVCAWPRLRQATEASVPAHRAAWPQWSSPHRPTSRARTEPAQCRCERTRTCLLVSCNQEERFWSSLSANLTVETHTRTARARLPPGPGPAGHFQRVRANYTQDNCSMPIAAVIKQCCNHINIHLRVTKSKLGLYTYTYDIERCL